MRLNYFEITITLPSVPKYLYYFQITITLLHKFLDGPLALLLKDNVFELVPLPALNVRNF